MRKTLLSVAGALLVMSMAAQAQTTASDRRIRISKDGTTSSANGDVSLTPRNDSIFINEARLASDWYVPTGTTCSGVDVQEARTMQIKTDLYDASTMISPDSAKMVALCAVPGQIGSGEINLTDNRPEYAIAIIPNGKKTYTKVIVDAQTGAVLSTKQFGGLRGLTGWLRESREHQENKP